MFLKYFFSNAYDNLGIHAYEIKTKKLISIRMALIKINTCLSQSCR